MKVERLALVQGWPVTRTTLQRWNASPWRVLRGWALGSLAVTALLLTATWLVAITRLPDPVAYVYPGVTRLGTMHDFRFVLGRNATVLTLHSLACVAGFIAGSSMPGVAQSYTGVWRRVHELAGLFALFLPLAAWTIASRRDAWNELLAATVVTTAIAVPLLLIAATIETWVTPSLLNAVSG